MPECVPVTHLTAGLLLMKVTVFEMEESYQRKTWFHSVTYILYHSINFATSLSLHSNSDNESLDFFKKAPTSGLADTGDPYMTVTAIIILLVV